MNDDPNQTDPPVEQNQAPHEEDEVNDNPVPPVQPSQEPREEVKENDPPPPAPENPPPVSQQPPAPAPIQVPNQPAPIQEEQKSNQNQPPPAPQTVAQEQRQEIDISMSPEIVRTLRNQALEDYRNFQVKILDYIRIHERMMEMIQKQLITLAETTENSLHSLYKFFEDKVKFYKEYAKLCGQKTQKLTTSMKLTGSDKAFPQLTKAFEEVDALEAKSAVVYEQFAIYIEKTIMADLLGPTLILFKQKLGSFKTSLGAQKEAKTKIDTEAKKKGQKFLKLIQEEINLTGTGVPLKKVNPDRLDVYSLMVQAIWNYFQLLVKTRGIAKEILTFWNSIIQLETSRMESMAKAITIYLTKAVEIQPKIITEDVKKDVLEGFSPQDSINSLLSIISVLGEEDYKYMMTLMPNKKEITHVELHHFFCELTLEFPKQTALVKKFLTSLRPEPPKAEGVSNETSLIVTLDNFLLLFPTNDPFGNSAVPPEKIFDLYFTKFVLKPDCVTIEIIETKPGIIFASTEKSLVKFKSSEEAASFMALGISKT